MPPTNRVQGTFTMEASQAFRTADAIEARYKRLQGQLQNFGKINVTVTNASQQQVRDAAAYARLQNTQTQGDIKQVQLAKEKVRLEQERLRLSQAQNRNQNTSGGGFLGLGETFTNIGIITAGLYTAAQAYDAVIDRSIEAAKSNRILAASATEAGISFASAAEKNKKFADLIGQSERQAAQTSGAILRLAARAGQPQNADKLLGGFANLGAAYGIDSGDLQTLIGTILSGQDEGLNRLGIADPGQLYKQHAAGIGKSVEQLTQYEKVTAAVNAVMKKSEIFNGAAEARMNSFEGSVLKNRAAWDSLTTSMAVSISQSPLIKEALTTYSALFKALTLDVDAFNKKLSEGKSPKQAVDELVGSGPGVTDVIQGAVSGLPALLGLVNDVARGNFQDAANNLNATINPFEIAKRNKQDLYDQAANQAKLSKDQEKAAQAQADALKKEMQLQEEKTKELERQAEVVKGYQALIADKDTSVAQLRELSSSLDSALSEKEKKGLQDDISEAIKNNIKEAVEQAKQLKDQFTGVFDQLYRASNTTNPFVSVIFDAQKAMIQVRKETQGLTDDLKSQAVQMQQNVNQLNLFNARADARFGAFDLMQEAANFRNAVSPEQKQRSSRNFLFDNPNYLFLMEQEFNARRGNSSDPLSYNGTSFDEFLQRDMARRRGEKTPQQILQERVDAQLAIAQGLGAQTAAERAAADRRIISLTSGVDPSQLTTRENIDLAAVREREAERLLRSEGEAFKIQQDQLVTQQGILKGINRLVGVAQNGGTAALNAEIKLTDESGSGNFSMTTTSRPNMNDTRDMYGFGGFDIAGGSNR